MKNVMDDTEIDHQVRVLIKDGYPPLFAKGRAQQIIANRRWRENRMKNPWLHPAPGFYPVSEIGPTSVEDRISQLRCFDSSKLRAVIKYPGTQKTVRARAETLLKRRDITRRDLSSLLGGPGKEIG